MLSVLDGDRKGTRRQKNSASITRYGITYFPSTSFPSDPLFLLSEKDMVFGKMWDVFVCPEKMHMSLSGQTEMESQGVMMMMMMMMFDDDVWFKVAGMSMMISDCPLNSVNSCLF